MRSSYELRPARESEQKQITNLIKLVEINPFNLNWRRFLVAVDENGQVIGCGQLKPHSDRSLELASIAVHPAYRRQGVAREIITQLLQQTGETVYLTCRKELLPFYQKFGFQIASPSLLPPYFKRILSISQWLFKIGLFPAEITVLYRSVK